MRLFHYISYQYGFGLGCYMYVFCRSLAHLQKKTRSLLDRILDVATLFELPVLWLSQRIWLSHPVFPRWPFKRLQDLVHSNRNVAPSFWIVFTMPLFRFLFFFFFFFFRKATLQLARQERDGKRSQIRHRIHLRGASEHFESHHLFHFCRFFHFLLMNCCKKTPKGGFIGRKGWWMEPSILHSPVVQLH